ncbi:MAG: VWA domain-containing protein [Acidobacteriia bacterium]|nr:VWA domain-containing protein [Terriglobia bacterium]
MKLNKFFLGGMFVLLLTATALPAPDPQQTPPGGEQMKRITVPVDYVSVLFTVTDKKNHFITNLKKDDFKVFENDQPQQTLIFRSETDLPLKIALLVDASASITGKLKFEQEAAIEFLQSILRKGRDEALLVTFDSSVELVQDFTDDIDLLSSAIRKIRAGGGTALYDAISRTAEEKLLTQKGNFRKVIIVITDGDDNQSHVQSLTEVIQMAQRADAAIYAISTNSSGFALSLKENSRKYDKILKEMADETGGQAFFPFKAQDLSQSFEDISRELRSQYNIGYTPANSVHDGKFRTIRIVAEDKHLHVKARRGYFAPAETH